jgi:hypothetical protein
MLSIILAAMAFGRWFRLFSGCVLLTLIGCGIWTSTEVSAMEANLATPSIGVAERIMIGAFMLWLAVFAAALRKRSKKIRDQESGL